MLEILNISKKYKNKVVLNNISASFKKGKSYMIVGGNGTGKSTLIKIIVGLIKPDKGVIKKDNLKIGYVPERFLLPEYIKVRDYLIVLGKIRKIYDETIIDELLKEWGLYCYKDYKVKQLSKGMVQKIVIIQALIHNPDIYIFDEALNGLDVEMQEKLLMVIKKLKEDKKIIIITSHYPKIYQNFIDVVYEIKKCNVEKIINFRD